MSIFSANDAFKGYMFQARYALFLLLKQGRENPFLEQSIESLDDVSFEEEGNVVELIQLKHHREGNTIGDFDTDLWKTIRVWASAIENGKIKTENTIFTLITTAQAKQNSIPSKLYPDFKQRDEQFCLVRMKEVANTSKNQENLSAYKKFLSLSEPKQKALIQNIRVLDGSSNIQDVTSNIHTELSWTIDTERMPAFYERLEGWWFNKVIHMLGNDIGLAKASRRELELKINSIREYFHEENLPIDFKTLMAPRIEELPENERIFIRQLELIQLEKPLIDIAIRDYYRAYKQRCQWVRDGLLFDEDMEEYETTLKEEWTRHFVRMNRSIKKHTQEEEKVQEGLKLFDLIDNLDKEGLCIKPRVKESYVRRGCYHKLANDLEVGWHVHFVERLKGLLADAQEAAK